ncbi:unnamed protein product [Paramecium octaurelia]|uniref:Uncharacterized protein n=1 Tax=Paramecium octaurelia TaxID=43137 RepID=A0A8S1WWE7_PAROT|nr:unnamed protein product [Paramecium octaurelia]
MANFHYCYASILFIQIWCFEVSKLNPYYQLEQQAFEFNDANFTQNECFTYGIWSKYNPLSITSQVGSLGLLDSNCFHLHNIMGQSSQSLNLIYYDCLDENTQSIKKILEFINEDEEVFKFEISIDVLEYENIWYFLQIVEWPGLFKLEFVIFQEITMKMHEIKQMQRPFKDKNIVLRFGGDLIVTNSNIPNLYTNTKFAYFPGFIMIQKLSTQSLELDVDFDSFVQSTYSDYGYCECELNEEVNLPDVSLDWLDKQIYISKNTNCESFILSGDYIINRGFYLLIYNFISQLLELIFQQELISFSNELLNIYWRQQN